MPSDSSLERIERQLADIHRPRVEPPVRDATLERELLAEWAARYGEGRGTASDSSAWRSGVRVGWRVLLATHRLALACFALLVVVAGACVLPTSYDIPLGLSIEIRTQAGALPAQDIARYVQSRAEASRVDVMLSELMHDDRPESHMQIRMWDQSLALGEIEDELREEFPSLADAEIDESPLEGEIETVWGRRLVHLAFDLSLREADLEEARIELLVRLHEQGFDEDEITVKVRDRDDGHREVEVHIDHHDFEPEGGMPPFDAVHGPGFRWVHDASGPEAIEVPTRGEHHGPVRIELRRAKK